MSPNPYLLLRTLVNPHRWFKTTKRPEGEHRVEYWDEPTPGAYQYVPGRGWSLIATSVDDGQTLEKLDEPVAVVYCRILHRNVLRSDYENRKKHGLTTDEHGRGISGVFFRLDDGLTWICRWNKDGLAYPSDKMQPYVVDAETGKFRVKRRSDSVIHHQRGTGSIASSEARSRVTANPSARSFVDGDVHKRSQSSTTPSTRPGTRPVSIHGTPSAQIRRVSTSKAPSMIKGRVDSANDLDAPELQRRLENLKLA